MIKRCKKSILLYTFAYIIIFMLSKVILSALGIKYRQYIDYFSIILILVGIIASLIQLFIKAKAANTKICIVICIISIIGVTLISIPIIALLKLFSPPEYVVEKDNEKYVAYVYSWLDTRVEYYTYINFFLVGKNQKIEDFYNNVGRDVLAKDAEGLFSPSRTIYYDNNGEIINIDYKTKKTEINVNEIENNQKNEEKIEEQKNYEIVYTSEQLKKYEKDFNTFTTNGFIISTNTYNKPSEIDLEQVFYCGAGFNNDVSKEEIEEYKKIVQYNETDIVKITTEQAEKLYFDNTGEKLENLKERLKNWTYIEKYDAYYNEISDINFETVSCIKGIMNEEYKTMKIQLSNNRTISVKIDYEKGTYYIISNKATK